MSERTAYVIANAADGAERAVGERQCDSSPDNHDLLDGAFRKFFRRAYIDPIHDIPLNLRSRSEAPRYPDRENVWDQED